MIKKLIILTVIFCAFDSFAKQKFYKRVNKDGSIEYFNKKPENLTTSEVTIKTKTPEINTEDYQQELDEIVDQNQQRKLQFKQKQIDREKIKQKHQKICNSAQENLSSLRSLGKCGWHDPVTGAHYEHLGDEKRGQLYQKYSQQSNKYCKSR